MGPICPVHLLLNGITLKFSLLSPSATLHLLCTGTHSRQTLEATVAPCKKKSSANSTDGGDTQNENNRKSSQMLLASPTLAFVANSSLHGHLKFNHNHKNRNIICNLLGNGSTQRGRKKRNIASLTVKLW